MSADDHLAYLKGLARESTARASLCTPTGHDPISDALIDLSTHRRAAIDAAWRAMTRLGLEVTVVGSERIIEHAIERMAQEIERLREEARRER